MRRSGVLLPVSSLPSRFGVGGMGKAARDFAHRLSEAGQSVWQVLPFSVPDFVHSPYASPSAFAGNPLFIDPSELTRDGLLTEEEIGEAAAPPGDHADYGRAARVKGDLLHRAFLRFVRDENSPLREPFCEFCHTARHWLSDFALFDALREAHGGAPFWEWEEELREREPAALERAASALSEQIREKRFLQFLFQRQLTDLRTYLAARGISLLGDIPFYVAADSADVWTHPELFCENEVAGVPPDFFTREGQLWGNPIYNWERMSADGYAWWMERLWRCGEMYDEIRLDHFRALDSYYAIPKGAKDATAGQWRRGPGASFFDTLAKRLPGISLIAEDLGDITPDVTALREYARIPGMRILQFAFGSGAENPFLPHNYERQTVVYLGTHDNDTTAGWWESTDGEGRRAAARYLGIGEDADGKTAVSAMMRAASSSVADTVIFTVQDLLFEGSEARINTPAKIGGCWEYAVRSLMAEDFEPLRRMTETYGRGKSEK